MDKIYDATVTATLNTSGAVFGAGLDPDSVGGLRANDAGTLDQIEVVGASGYFTAADGIAADKNVAFDASTGAVIAKSVVATELQLSGGTSNYYLVQEDDLSAKIVQREIAITDAVGKSKVFDATTTAEIEGLEWQVLTNDRELMQISDTSMANDSIAPTYTANFSDMNAGQGKSITLAFTGMTGADGAN